MFTNCSTTALFKLIFPSTPYMLLSDSPVPHDTIKFKGMDSMYVPYHCGTLADWLLMMVALVNSLIQSISEFRVATLWIPSAFLLLHIPSTYTPYFAHLVSGWQYKAYIYNTAAFGDYVAAARVCLQICEQSDRICHEQLDPSTPVAVGYGSCINSKFNNDLTCNFIPLITSVAHACAVSSCSKRTLGRPIAKIHSEEIGLCDGTVLDADYPAIELITGGGSSLFGNRFGVPFCDEHGAWLCRGITSIEIISCYSINTSSLMGRTCHHNLDVIVDSLLPECLPWKTGSYIAQSTARTNQIFDSHVYA